MEILKEQPSVAGPAESFTGVVHFDVIAPGTESRDKVRLTPGAVGRVSGRRRRPHRR